MVQNYRYRSPATPGSAGFNVDLGNQAVRLGNISGITQEAELGAVGTSSIAIDDLTGTAGHDSDAILGLKQFDWIESAPGSGNRRIWTGYIGDRTYRRGTGSESPSLRTGPARVIDITLVDINAFLGFRLLGVDATSAFNRPAETDVARVTALLAVDFLSDTLFDGLVSTANPVDMDAVDYTGQRPSDVLNDCAQQSGKNFFAFYDEAGTYTPDPGDIGLFYDSNNSLVYPAHDPTLKVSNVLADVNVTANEPTGPVWEPLIDAQLVRDPSRVISGAFFQNGSNSVYVTNATTSYTYGWRDAVGNTQNLKTSAQALSRGARYLTENATEDDRITFTLKLPAANVNDWQVGQYAPVKFSHLPGYESYTNVRCLTRTTMQDELTDEFYDVRYEVTPMVSGPVGAFARYETGVSWDGPGTGGPGIPCLRTPTTPGNTLLAVIVSQAATVTHSFSSNPGFFDDPVLPWTAPTPGSLAGWTLVASEPVWDSGMFPGPSGAIRIDVAYRAVGVAETTLNPVSVSPCAPAGALGVALWELPGTVVPTLVANGHSNFTPGGTYTVGTALAATTLGVIAIQHVDYAKTPTVTPENATVILNAAANNDPSSHTGAGADRWTTPWIWIAQPAGGQIIARIVNTDYTNLGVTAVGVNLPGLAGTLPSIPYPANQT